MSDATGPRRPGAIVGLTAVAAAADGLSYLGLGHVFPANMTGNTALLGLGLATGDRSAAARSAVALGAYVLAAFAVGVITAERRTPRWTRAAFAVELLVLAALAGWWLNLPAHPAGAARFGLVALAGAAMGIQSATVQGLRLPGIATTYITGTWTTLANGLGQRLRGVDRKKPTGRPAQALVVAVYPVVACAVGLAYEAWPAAAALVPGALLALALAAIWVGAVHGSPSPAADSGDRPAATDSEDRPPAADSEDRPPAADSEDRPPAADSEDRSPAAAGYPPTATGGGDRPPVTGGGDR